MFEIMAPEMVCNQDLMVDFMALITLSNIAMLVNSKSSFHCSRPFHHKVGSIDVVGEWNCSK